MSYADNKKMTLLKELLDKEVPVGIYELLEELPKGFADRSVRRWLDELSQLKLIEKIGLKKGTKYQIANPISFSLREESSCPFKEESLHVIRQIQRPLKERRPVAYNEQFLDRYIPNRTFYMPFPTRAALLKEGKRAKNEAPAGTYARLIFNRLLIDLSYNSSRLEGNTYTLLDTEKLLLHGTAVEGKLDDEKIMILNHKEAIRFLVDHASRLEVTRNTICTLHRLLADGLIDAHDLGVVRSNEVFIGGSKYLPFSNKSKLQEVLECILAKAALIHDPYEQSFFLLTHLCYLQPFADVNKRTSRLSCNIPLIKNNLVPLSFNDVVKEDYISAILAVYELQDLRPLTDLYVFSYNRTCALYDTTIQALSVDILRVQYRQQRRKLLANIILNQIVGPKLQTYIQKEASKLIPPKHLADFLQDLAEDLATLDETHLYGLGVTLQEFNIWNQINK